MQRAGHVGRRDDDAIGLGLGALRPAGAESARRLPGGINAALDRAGQIAVFDHRRLLSPRRAPLSARTFQKTGFHVARQCKKPAPRAVSTLAMLSVSCEYSQRVIRRFVARLAQNPDPLHHAACGRRLCQPGASARHQFAAAANRHRLPYDRGRRRHRRHRLCHDPRIHSVRRRPGRRSFRQISHGRHRQRGRRGAGRGLRHRVVAAAARHRAAGDRRGRRLGDPGLDGLSRRRDAGRPSAADSGALRVGLHSRPAFRPGRRRRARRSVRLAQRVFRARRHVRAGGGGLIFELITDPQTRERRSAASRAASLAIMSRYSPIRSPA